MNLWNFKLTDNQSAKIRLILNVCWSLPLLAVVYFLGMRGSELFIVAGAYVYLAVFGFIQDHRKLRHPRASPEEEWRFGFLPILVLLIAIPLFFYLFR